MSNRLSESSLVRNSFMRRSRRSAIRALRFQIVCSLPSVRVALDGMISEGFLGEVEICNRAIADAGPDWSKTSDCDALIVVEPQNPAVLNYFQDSALQAGIPVLLSAERHPDFLLATETVWIPFSAALDQWRVALNRIVVLARCRARKKIV